MSKYLRHQQHRPEAEEKTRNKLLSDLKKENHQLRKTVSKLQKRLTKMMESMDLATIMEEEDVQPMTTAPVGCPQCQSPTLVEVQLPFGVLKACKSCGYRKTHGRDHPTT